MVNVEWVIIKDLQGKIEEFNQLDNNIDSIRVLKDKIIIKYKSTSTKGAYKKIILISNITSYETPDIKPNI